MKKVISILMAVIMVFSCSALCFADDATTTTAAAVTTAESTTATQGLNVSGILSTVANIFDKIVETVKTFITMDQQSDLNLIETIMTKITDLLKNFTTLGSQSNVAGAVSDLESKIAELGLSGNSTIGELLTNLKQKIKSFYAGEKAVVEEITEAEASADTGSSSIGMVALASVCVASAAAFVCTKKKDN